MRSLAGILVLALAGVAVGQELPGHPKDLKYPELKFEPPKPEEHRVVLPNGLRLYIVPDKAAPALRVEAFIESREVFIPKEKRGLSHLTGELMRSGGIEGLDARALDAELDRRAIDIEASFDLERGHVTLWTLPGEAERGLELFAGVMRRPVFADDRIRRAKDELKEEIAHRDDEPHNVLDHEVAKRIYGEDHPLALRESAASVDAVTREDIAGYHKLRIHAGNTILAVSGPFERDALKAMIEKRFGDWSASKDEQVALAPPAAPRPGVFVLDRPDMNQGFVEIVQAGIKLGDKDEIPLKVMNYILGGGSFTSYITKRVRNDEGLAYSAGSYVHPKARWPGLVAAYFQSKAESTAFAAKLCVECIETVQKKDVPEGEIQRAKDALLGRFPEQFTTAHETARILAENELDGRPSDWLATWRARVAAVGAADIRRVATERLALDRMATVVVGPAKVVLAEDEKNKASVARLGKVEMLKEEAP